MSQKNEKKNDKAQDISEILRLLKQSVESDRATMSAENDGSDEKKDSGDSEFSYSMEGFLNSDESKEHLSEEGLEEESLENDVVEEDSSEDDDVAPWEEDLPSESDRESLEIEIADESDREPEEDDEDPWFTSSVSKDTVKEKVDEDTLATEDDEAADISEEENFDRNDDIENEAEVFEKEIEEIEEVEEIEEIEEVEEVEEVEETEETTNISDVEDIAADEPAEEIAQDDQSDDPDDMVLTVDDIDEAIAEIEREKEMSAEDDDMPSWYQDEIEKRAPAERDDHEESDEEDDTFFDFNDFAYVSEDELTALEKKDSADKEDAEFIDPDEYFEENEERAEGFDDDLTVEEDAEYEREDDVCEIDEQEYVSNEDEAYESCGVIIIDESCEDEPAYDAALEQTDEEEPMYDEIPEQPDEDELVYDEFCEEAMISEDEYDEFEEDIDKELVEAEDESEDMGGLDETDMHLLSKLGYSSVGASEEVIKQGDHENHSSEPSGDISYDYDGEEYIFEKQRDEIRAGYSVAKKNALIRLLIAGGAAFLLLIYEMLVACGVVLPWLFNQYDYALSHIMISLQLLIIAGAMSIRSILKGVTDAACMRATPQSVSAAVIIMNMLYTVVIAIIIPENYVLFNFVGSLAAVLSIGYEYLGLINESHTFDVVSLKDGARYAFGEDERLYEVFGEPAPSLRAYSTDFNKHFFAKMKRRTVSYKYLSVLIVSTFALMLAVCGISLLATGSSGEALRNAISVINFTLPLGVLGAYVLPMLKVTKVMLGKNAALIGHGTVDKYVNTRFVTFDEEDLFPSIKTTHIDLKPSGNHNISAVLRKTGKLFSAIGGPMKKLVELSDTFDGDDVIINDIFDDGISATVESSEILAGSARFLEINGVDPSSASDYRDADGNNEVLYIAIDGSLAARYYIKYLPDPDFVKAVNKLGDKRIAVGIKTCNPGINSNIILRRCPEMKYKIYAIKSGYDCADEIDSHRALTDGDLISAKKSVFLAYPLLACLALKKYYKSDAVFRWTSAAVGALTAICIALAGRGLDINSLGIAIYQLLWFAPSVAAALIDFRRDGVEKSKKEDIDNIN